jgi:hypothetical protein
MQLLTGEINRLLKIHGLNTEVINEWIIVNGDLPALTAAIANEQQHENGIVLRLDVVVMLESEMTIHESFAGIGETREEAVNNALENFCDNSLHVLLAALWGVVDKDQVTIEKWEINGSRWVATIGGYGVRGSNVEGLELPETLFPTIETRIKELPLSKPVHWVRTFYCNLNDTERVAEVLLDNEPWNSGRGAIENLNWAASNEFYSVRNFLMLRKLAL